MALTQSNPTNLLTNVAGDDYNLSLLTNDTITGTGTVNVSVAALSTLTFSGAGTNVIVSGLAGVTVGSNIVVTDGAAVTLDPTAGISALSSFQIGTDSSLTIAASLGASVIEPISFAPGSTGATLELGNQTNVTVGLSISGFAPGNDIVLDGTDVTGGVYSNGVLTLTTTTGSSVSLAISNTGLAGEYFHFTTNASDQTTLTLSTDPTNGIPACYHRGTQIATPNGPVAVEKLAIGDLVTTTGGAYRQVRWVGRRSYSRRFLQKNRSLFPVRFAAGSLGEGLPRRDLLVSPNHSMYLDDVLVPARCLVNGTTIRPDMSLETVEYFHIELLEHDIIFAEGAPSETFVDDDSRGIFQNAAEFAQLYPDLQRPACFFAPRVEAGPALERIRQRLAPSRQEVA